MRLFAVPLNGTTPFSSSPSTNTVYVIKLSHITIQIHQFSTGFFWPCPSARWRPEPRRLDLYWNCCWWQELYFRLYPTWGPVRLHFRKILHTNFVYLSVPTILISPWVGKAVIEHEGTNNGHTYTHSSIAGFISKAKPVHLLNMFLMLMNYYGSASSGISTTESPWQHVWLSRLPSSISSRTISVTMFQSPFPALIETKWELTWFGHSGISVVSISLRTSIIKCNLYTFLERSLVCLTFVVVELVVQRVGMHNTHHRKKIQQH